MLSGILTVLQKAAAMLLEKDISGLQRLLRVFFIILYTRRNIPMGIYGQVIRVYDKISHLIR